MKINHKLVKINFILKYSLCFRIKSYNRFVVFKLFPPCFQGCTFEKCSNGIDKFVRQEKCTMTKGRIKNPAYFIF